MRPGDRAATRAAVGNSVVSEANGVSIGSPNVAAKRPATVRAAATVTCWPRIARTAISKPSNAPGTRKPGWRFASAPSACATSAGWHARSISALTRESTGGSALASDAETVTRSVGFFGDISDRDPAAVLLAVDRDAHRAAIAAALHRFDAGDRARAEECAHRAPSRRAAGSSART